jgi:hypothetical protein
MINYILKRESHNIKHNKLLNTDKGDKHRKWLIYMGEVTALSVLLAK